MTAESLAIDPLDDARGVLRRVFGHAAFKGLQEPVIGMGDRSSCLGVPGAAESMGQAPLSLQAH